MQLKLIPIPVNLKEHVECIRTVEHCSETGLAINVCLNGLPGIVFQHHEGHSPIENITTPSGITTCAPTLYLYGQITEPGVMNHKKEPFSTIQIVLKPHALQSLLGINASVVTDSIVGLDEFSARDLNMRLIEASDEQERITLLTNFLSAMLNQAKARDCLIEESLHLIH